jgi:hypothetical protein
MRENIPHPILGAFRACLKNVQTVNISQYTAHSVSILFYCTHSKDSLKKPKFCAQNILELTLNRRHNL